MPGLLDNKVAIITGGASGLGAAGVRRFVEEGARVAVADIRAPREDFETVYGDKVIFVKCDVSSEEAVAAMVTDTVGRFGGLDILYNNAGGGSAPGKVVETQVEEWEMNMAVMLRSVMLMTKHAVPHIAARGGGSVINTASIAGLRPGIAGLGYSVSKAAVLHFTRMIVAELGSQKIRVNTICPGLIPTPALGGAWGLDYETTLKIIPGIAEIYSTAVPLKSVGKPEDIANTALFLASDASRFITGQEISVDGGLTLSAPAAMDAGFPGNLIERMVDYMSAFKKEGDAR